MFDRVMITPLSFLVELQAFNLQPTTLLKDGLLHRYFSKIWELSRKTYLNEHLWTAAPKEADVIKSAFKVYDSLYKRCWITPQFLDPF